MTGAALVVAGAVVGGASRVYLHMHLSSLPAAAAAAVACAATALCAGVYAHARAGNV